MWQQPFFIEIDSLIVFGKKFMRVDNKERERERGWGDGTVNKMIEGNEE